MCTTVIGGMLAASLIGVFFIPVVFYVVEKWSGAGKEKELTVLRPKPTPAEGN
jgi:HAE1 family hydrophobic/amphiphilic exporter-1